MSRCRSSVPALERTVSIGEAANALGVSLDTIRRWERSGRIRTERDSRNHRLIPESEITRLGGREPSESGTGLSARNHFEGVVTAVEISGVVALVEIEAGPHRIVSVITRDAVQELGLVPGVAAVATVKATSVMVQRPTGARPGPPAPRG
jgi:molybdopterin-binding protein